MENHEVAKENEDTVRAAAQAPFIKFATICFEVEGQELALRLFRPNSITRVSFGTFYFLSRVTKSNAIAARASREWVSITTVPLASSCCKDLLLPTEDASYNGERQLGRCAKCDALYVLE